MPATTSTTFSAQPYSIVQRFDGCVSRVRLLESVSQVRYHLGLIRTAPIYLYLFSLPQSTTGVHLRVSHSQFIGGREEFHYVTTFGARTEQRAQ